MSRVSPDIRKPCGSSKPSYGGCYNNKKNSDNSVPKLINVTKVPDYAPDSLLLIDPYTRPNAIQAPDCGQFSGYECGDGINGNQFCGIPTDTTICNGASSFNVGSNDLNCYQRAGETTDYSTCRQIGTKKVYAFKNWQGRYGYNDRFWGLPDKMDWCGNCAQQLATNDPPTTKYLSMHATATITQISTLGSQEGVDSGIFNCNGEDIPNICTNYTQAGQTTITSNASSTCAMNRFGNITGTCSSGSTGCDSEAIEDCEKTNADEAYALLEIANSTVTNLLPVSSDLRINIEIPPDKITGDGNRWDMRWTADFTSYDGCGNFIESHKVDLFHLVIDLRAGVLDYYVYGTIGALSYCGDTGVAGIEGDQKKGGAWTEIEHINYSYSGTTMHYSRRTYQVLEGGLLIVERTEEVTGTMSNGYSIAQVKSEMEYLLSLYPLGDDVLLPWRLEMDMQGPLVSYHENAGGPFIPCCEDSIVATGRIMGLPAPRGIDKVWNREIQVYDSCRSNNGFEDCDIKYIDSYGQFSDQIGIPHATQWLNRWQASNMAQGAFISMGQQWTNPSSCGDAPVQNADNIIWGCKYAETLIEPRKSYNFARPCGKDRFTVSESYGRCITGVTGNTIDIDGAGDTIATATGEKVFVCGTSDLDGVWNVIKNSDYQVTLVEPRIVSASALPDFVIENCGDGIIGRLKWQNMPSPICGKLDIVSANTHNPVTCSLSDYHWLVDGDLVVITEAIGLPLNGVKTVKVIDNTTIALVGTNGTGGNYTANSGYIRSLFGADWKWNDESPKHQYRVQTWIKNFRDLGEYNRCLADSIANGGGNDCQGETICEAYILPPYPRATQAACGLDQNIVYKHSETICQPVSPCGATIAYFSPVLETFRGSSINHGWGYPPLDSVYGTWWSGLIQQTDNDYLWNRPEQPCPHDTGWQTDNGTCIDDTDTISYYPFPPQVEAVQEIPLGAPQIPTNVSVGCLSLGQIQSGNCNGNLCNPQFAYPHADTLEFTPVYQYPMYHELYILEQTCVCNGGHFAADYEQNGVKCG